MATTRIINIRNAPMGWKSNPNYVYIGRPGYGMTGEFGNVHVIGWCAICRVEHTRRQAINANREDLRQKIIEPNFLARILTLRGKILVCFCKPLDCHGDNYVEILTKHV